MKDYYFLLMLLLTRLSYYLIYNMYLYVAERNYGSLGWRETRRRQEIRQTEDPNDRRLSLFIFVFCSVKNKMFCIIVEKFF